MNRNTRMKIAPEGRTLIISISFLSLGLAAAGFFLNSALLINVFRLLALLLLFCLNFFRDPHRTVPKGDSIVVSPADGKIVKIEKIKDKDVGEDATLVSIFLNVFNVHRNRVPFSGKVLERQYKKGKFLAAFDHKSSDENEQTVIIFQTEYGKVKIKQIAGLIARRIFCYANKGSKMASGDNLGFIRFGSRTDLILPGQFNVLVKTGQKVKGAETVIAELKKEIENEKQR